MNPRLRSMTLDADSTVLVIDRLGPVLTPERVAKIADMGKHVGMAGTLVFDFEIDLPNDDPQPEGLTIHADELAALRWAVTTLAVVGHDVVGSPKSFFAAKWQTIAEIVYRLWHDQADKVASRSYPILRRWPRARGIDQRADVRSVPPTEVDRAYRGVPLPPDNRARTSITLPRHTKYGTGNGAPAADR
jgi:hypothetical protein